MPLTPRPLAPLALRLVEIPGIPRVRGVQAVGLARLPTLIRGGASPLRRAAEQHPAQHRDLLRQLRDPGIGLRERLLGPLGTLTPVRHISGVTGHRREGHVLQNTPSPSNTPRTAPGVSRTKPQPRRRPRLQTHAALTPHVTTGGHSDSARPPTGSPNTYLDADLKSAFDKIDHNFLLERIGTFPAREQIRGWLKAGVVDRGRYSPTHEGTPQGGVISPLLLNIALQGMEEAAGVTYEYRGNVKAGCPTVITYADDFVALCHSREQAETVQTRLGDWLKKRRRGVFPSTRKRHESAASTPDSTSCPSTFAATTSAPARRCSPDPAATRSRRSGAETPRNCAPYAAPAPPR